jgi:hypothetical protein
MKSDKILLNLTIALIMIYPNHMLGADNITPILQVPALLFSIAGAIIALHATYSILFLGIRD